MASKTKLLMNVEKIRQDFPILSRTTRGKPLVYLDSAATSQKPRAVIDSVSDFFSRYNANVHRAIYELGEEATREDEGAREKVAQFIHARTPNEVAFTKSTTESLNTIAYGWGIKGKLREGDEIVSTVMEHHANHVPWFFVQDAKGVKMKWVGMTDDGALRMEEYDDLITKRTKVVTVTQCSNVLGTINPVQEIAKRAHEVGAICVVDGAQSVPHMAVDVQKIDCDFLAFSGHKMLGPTGIGVLYGKEERLQEMEPRRGDLVHPRRRPPARHRLDPRRRGDRDPLGSPLRAAPHGTAERPRDRAGVLLRIQHPRGSRPARGGPPEGAGRLRVTFPPRWGPTERIHEGGTRKGPRSVSSRGRDVRSDHEIRRGGDQTARPRDVPGRRVRFSPRARRDA